jgi:membrane-bound lytic murein transglycosylase D
MHRQPAIVWILVVSALGILIASPAMAAREPFPHFAVIEPNVDFWTDVYSRYPTTQAIVHDSVRLDIIYDVIDLKPADQPGARKINRKRMKRANERFSKILKRLATDPQASDPEGRRVAALFGPQADARTFSRARHRVRSQIGQRDRFRAGLIRSGAYLDQMRAILKSKGVPEDLAYLPHVESSFNIKAYSKFGAAGMWQFTRSTGKRFMTVDYVLDERRDPIAATHAAARLLRENYDKLGSWPLAITAYNHGAAGMQRAKAAHGDYPAVFASYQGRTFKFASRNFYAEFLAARRVASDFHTYFGPLTLDRPVRTRSVRLDGYVPFADLCRHFKISPQVARSMNPALRPPVFSGQKYVPRGYVLNLPAGSEADGLAVASIPWDLLKKRQKPSRFYTVQRGDTAGKIARIHRVTLGDLILANNLDRRATVYVRQTLRIPQDGDVVRAANSSRPPVSKSPAVAVAAVDSSMMAAAPVRTIPVADADLHYRRPGPSPADLLAMTDTGGTELADPPAEPAGVAPPTTIRADVRFDRILEVNNKPVGIIQVEVEETLGHYAEWAGVRASRIRRLNKLPFGQALHLHQRIMVPLSTVAAADFEARRYEFHQRLQEDFFAAYRVGELQRYRVKPGDSYWSLCREKFDLPLWLLKHYNAEVNLAALRIHQPLTIPAIESILGGNPGAIDTMATPEA